jgi:hypothetical protein
MLDLWSYAILTSLIQRDGPGGKRLHALCRRFATHTGSIARGPRISRFQSFFFVGFVVFGVSTAKGHPYRVPVK